MLNKLAVLFRKSLAEEGEFDVCRKYFLTSEYRTFIPYCSLVVPRYSCLPYYRELEVDLQNRGCQLINSYEQHKWIANFEWYNTLKDHTPKTWDFEYDFCRCQYDGPFVVKGKTNSRKFQWNSQMFAKNKRDAIEVASEISKDSMIGNQGIIIREYVPLKTYEIGLNGLPFTNEWRFFFYKTNLLSCGYYWSCAEKTDYEVEPNMIGYALNLAKIVSNHVNFFVLDIAENEDEEYMLVEINDASMSGLSENNPHTLYKQLKTCLQEEIKNGQLC